MAHAPVLLAWPRAAAAAGGGAVLSVAALRARRLELDRHHVVVAGVVGLSALLNLGRLSQNGWANTYYAAVVRSMLRSPHDFFFVSFDPGGLVSADKPPLALWVEAASAKVFGYSGLSLLVPEALAGIAAVWLLYLLVARFFGCAAGVVAALALTVSPVSVAIDRDNNPDALFVLLLVAAAYTGARAAESRRLRTLLLTAVLVGLAFDTKMLLAALVVPGIALAYQRLAHLVVAAAALVVTGGWWLAIVQLAPAAARPWVGSTSDDNVLSLLLGYNGLGRVAGQAGGTSTGGFGGGGTFSGSPGILRLWNGELGDQIGWLLVLAIVGGVSAGISARGRRRIALVVLGGWFVCAAAVLSAAGGIVHTYYVSALAPASAGLVGIGVVSLWRDARRGGIRAVRPVVGFGGAALVEVDLLRRSGYLSWLQTVVLLGASCAVVLVAGAAIRGAWPSAWVRRGATAAAAVATAALLAAPLAWSATTWQSPVNGVFPGAGPSFTSSRGLDGLGGSDLSSVLSWVKAHGATKRFTLIVSNEEEAAPYIVAGERLASMGGFTGRETVISGAYLARLVRAGDARYFYLDRTGFMSYGNAGISRVESACTEVSTSLYDCAGKADALAVS